MLPARIDITSFVPKQLPEMQLQLPVLPYVVSSAGYSLVELVRQGVGRNLLMGDKQEVWKTELRSRVQGQSLGGGLEAKSAETGDKCACRLRK